MTVVIKSILLVRTSTYCVCIRHIQDMNKFYRKPACNYLTEIYFYNY